MLADRGGAGTVCRRARAIVVATDRYLAEDAADLIEVQYRARLPWSIRWRRVSRARPFSMTGFPAMSPATGHSATAIQSRHLPPRRTGSVSIFATPVIPAPPIETYGVVAEYDAGDDAYDVLANFQGPFSIHAVLSRALRVPGNRLRLRTPPDSGGSFGVKQGIFPYIVLIAAAARATRRPVKWIEDRLEHLTASVSAHQQGHDSWRGRGR